MTLPRALLILMIAAAFLYLRGPSAARVVSNTVLAADQGYESVRELSR